jgi:hypothetical protein
LTIFNVPFRMRPLKSLLLFWFPLALLACVDSPEYDEAPQIEFESVSFQGASSAGEKDLLVVTIHYKDGGGDLGLAANEIDPPYHDINYFLEKNGQLTPVGKTTKNPLLPQFIDVPPGSDLGKIVTVRTRKNPLYQSLPRFNDPYACTFYAYDSVFISEENRNIFDDDTHNLYKVISSPTNPDVYVLLDTFYYQRNPNYLNIEVDFLIRQSNGTYEEFDWEKEFCTSSFNQRFPRISDEMDQQEGTLQYTLASTGIRSVFDNKTLKLRVTIKDRALNVSNTVESPDFQL